MSEIRGKDPVGWNKHLPAGRLTQRTSVPPSEYVDSTIVEGMKAVKPDTHGFFGTRTGRNK
jgi:hypothetical protein